MLALGLARDPFRIAREVEGFFFGARDFGPRRIAAKKESPMDSSIIRSGIPWHWRIAGLATLAAASARAGIYAPAAGQPGSTAIPNSSPLFVDWASAVQSITRGPQDITNPAGPLATFGSPSDALGPAEGTSFNVVSLGDGGQITLTFPHGVCNSAGPDFAVFENGFSDNFLELAFVDVSSDGSHYFRFPSASLTQTSTQVSGFGSLDPTDLNNLAGKYRQGFGTPFDLEELKSVSPLLDVNNVQFVRVTDVIGTLDPLYGSRDSQGNLINDPYPTVFASGGVDLDGVGVINSAPEPTILAIAGIIPIILLPRRLRRASNRTELVPWVRPAHPMQ
jgi:hypothetical protein